MKQIEIVAAVREGRYDPITWAEVHSGPVAFQVMSDALKIDGVRVSVSARTAQQCADVLGASLTTALIEDLVFQASDVQIPAFPIPGGPGLTESIAWAQAASHSKRIDDALRVAGALSSQLVGTIGKSWVIGNALFGRIDKAINYGWHDQRAPYHGVSDELMVWQSVGTRHNADHFDYSQTLRLVRRSCRVTGAEATLADVLSDPDLSRNLSHEGPLRVFRQPGAEANV